MIRVEQAVIVEGRYDKIRLSSLIDGLIVDVGGFRIFKDQEKAALIAHLAKTRGIIILTDSDAAGFKIRNRIKNIARSGTIYHAYIPDVMGKERRKSAYSAEGKLGVEGMDTAILKDAFDRIGVETAQAQTKKCGITTADLFLCGYTGGCDSRTKKAVLLRHLCLPEHLSTAMLLKCVDGLMTREALYEFAEKDLPVDE